MNTRETYDAAVSRVHTITAELQDNLGSPSAEDIRDALIDAMAELNVARINLIKGDDVVVTGITKAELIARMSV